MTLLKDKIIDKIEDTYVCKLRNRYTGYLTGYLGVNTRDLLAHCIDHYGKITTADLEASKS